MRCRKDKKTIKESKKNKFFSAKLELKCFIVSIFETILLVE